MPDYRNAKLCAACGGKCCATIPGICAPSDFGVTPDEIQRNLVVAFRSREYAIDWWEGNPQTGDPCSQADYVRPAAFTRLSSFEISGNPRWLRDPLWPGEAVCVFLGPRGCKLSHDKRPFQCRALKPAPGADKCEMDEGADKKSLAIAWMPYQRVIAAAERLSGAE